MIPGMVVTQELRADVAVIAGALLALVTALLWWRARRILARVVHGEGRITHFKSEETISPTSSSRCRMERA